MIFFIKIQILLALASARVFFLQSCQEKFKIVVFSVEKYIKTDIIRNYMDKKRKNVFVDYRRAMLINFKVKNFRSFREEVEFSMETGKYLRAYKDSHSFAIKNYKLLKTALLFGGNANGKTNLLYALQLIKWLLMNPTQSAEDVLRTDTFSYNDDNTSLDITFIKNKKKFQYQLEYNGYEVVMEVLKIEDKTFIERHFQEFTVLPDLLRNFSHAVRKNMLLLFFAQSNNIPEAIEAYSWFYNDLVLVDTSQISNGMFKLLQNQEFKEKFLHFLQAADFNIVDVDVKEQRIPVPLEIKNMIEAAGGHIPVEQTLTYDLYSKHLSENGSFDVHFSNESNGTQTFIALALYILVNHADNNKVLLIDEFDDSFHKELAEALLDLFNDKEQKNQFILTTHGLDLMNHNLRPDQIWFAEKNKFGETELFSVYDFADPALTRMDYGYKKRYLQGRYGGKQNIHWNKLKEFLVDSDE